MKTLFDHTVFRYIWFLLLISCSLVLSTCEREHDDLVFSNQFEGKDPYNLRVEAQVNSVKLQWDSIDYAEGVNVYRSMSRGNGFMKIGISYTTGYEDTNIRGGVTYYYQLRAHKSNIEATPSLELEATTNALSGMVLIPAGEFEMGDHHNVGRNHEKPVHTVYLDAFYIDIYEVTNAQYAEFLNAYGKTSDSSGHELLDVSSPYCRIEQVGGIYKAESGYDDHPAAAVSWYGSSAYAAFHDKRLPTEAEWEKAARGGLVGKKYPWGDSISHDDANYVGTYSRIITSSPVGSFSPNGYGLYDMSGNVYEWCSDWYHGYYYSNSPRENPKGPSSSSAFTGSYRIARGGSCSSQADNLRCADRCAKDSTFGSNIYFGFRCGMSRSD